MTLSETAWWYLGNIIEYCVQMFPCMLVGVVGYLLARPFRRRRLQGKRLVSSVPRELALLLFIMFCAGLISVTLFPANLWSYVTDWLFFHGKWTMIWQDRTLASFYPPVIRFWGSCSIFLTCSSPSRRSAGLCTV